MSKPRVLKPREVVALLGKLGFVEVRQRGSHTALQPTAGEAAAPKKPPESGRG